ncbi:MAG: hypothetical protein JSV88_21020 [Candidatus Aminicenantes bacterium]|nr:MAG: hypothetical protein JSV88_21020 [Candidatus Aminicenantes bacterium]
MIQLKRSNIAGEYVEVHASKHNWSWVWPWRSRLAIGINVLWVLTFFSFFVKNKMF